MKIKNRILITILTFMAFIVFMPDIPHHYEHFTLTAAIGQDSIVTSPNVPDSLVPLAPVVPEVDDIKEQKALLKLKEMTESDGFELMECFIYLVMGLSVIMAFLLEAMKRSEKKG